MRTLIVGAGVAGLTLAALMRQRGEETPTIIERDASLASHGYMLGLFPLGGRVLHGLGLHADYMTRSTTMRSYNIGTGRRDLLREYIHPRPDHPALRPHPGHRHSVLVLI